MLLALALASLMGGCGGADCRETGCWGQQLCQRHLEPGEGWVWSCGDPPK